MSFLQFSLTRFSIVCCVLAFQVDEVALDLFPLRAGTDLAFGCMASQTFVGFLHGCCLLVSFRRSSRNHACAVADSLWASNTTSAISAAFAESRGKYRSLHASISNCSVASRCFSICLNVHQHCMRP